MKNWKNKNILITGGTSGLGEALAHHFLNKQANVSIVSRNPSEKPLQGAQYILGDVSDKKQVHRIVASVPYQNIDLLINAASYLGATPLRPLLDTDCEDFEKVLQTNLLGPFRLLKLVVPKMVVNGEGMIVNISSDAATNAYPTWGSYSISKSALDHLTRIFAEELRTTSVRWLAVDPGDMNTPMHLAAIPDADVENLKRPSDSAAKIIEIIENQDVNVQRRAV